MRVFFPEPLKVVKVSPIFKVGSIEEIGNYQPVLVFPIFSKVLERILYNRTYQYFKENDMFFSKQFGFQVNNSTHHAILNLNDDILESFEKGQFILGVFIDLSKVFGTVNHNTLLDKLELYGINGKCLNWFKNMLFSYHSVNTKIAYAVELLAVYHKALFLDHFCFSYI